MASTRPVDPFNVDFSVDDSRKRPGFRHLSFLNGLFIGLAFGLGAWGLEIWRIMRLPVASYLPALMLGMGAILVLCGFVGWLTGRFSNTLFLAILWPITAVISMFLLSYLPFYGRTLTIWLLDPRFWGRDIFPYSLGGRPAGIILGGLLIILTFTILGLIQNYRLENINSERDKAGKLTRHGWVSLLIPLPIVFAVSMMTQSGLSNPASAAIVVVNRAISGAQGYEGDLRLLQRGDGISYGALAPVQDQLSGDFTLSLVEMNPLSSTVIVRADFTDGGWIYCQVINDQLLYCFDAALIYTAGLHSTLTGEPLAEDCRNCSLQVDGEMAAWVADRQDRWGPDPLIERVAQQGSHVLMQITGDDITAKCWIEGVTDVWLTECREVVNVLR